MAFGPWAQSSQANKSRCLLVHLPVFTKLLLFAKQQHLGRRVRQEEGEVFEDASWDSCPGAVGSGQQAWVPSLNCQANLKSPSGAQTFAVSPQTILSPKEGRYSHRTRTACPTDLSVITGDRRRGKTCHLRRPLWAQGLWRLCRRKEDTAITACQAGQVFANNKTTLTCNM